MRNIKPSVCWSLSPDSSCLEFCLGFMWYVWLQGLSMIPHLHVLAVPGERKRHHGTLMQGRKDSHFSPLFLSSSNCLSLHFLFHSSEPEAGPSIFIACQLVALQIYLNYLMFLTTLDSYFYPNQASLHIDSLHSHNTFLYSYLKKKKPTTLLSMYLKHLFFYIPLPLQASGKQGF